MPPRLSASAMVLSLAVLVTALVSAPGAAACSHRGDHTHTPGAPCSEPHPQAQPSAHYETFMAKQRADVLAGFKARADARRAAEHRHYGSTTAKSSGGASPGRRLLAPTQPRIQHAAADSARARGAKEWYKMWRARLATATVPQTAAPTEAPTAAPTATPTAAPTEAPTSAPTAAPTESPTEAPTAAPTVEPTAAPTAAPSDAPTVEPAVASPATLASMSTGTVAPSPTVVTTLTPSVSRCRCHLRER